MLQSLLLRKANRRLGTSVRVPTTHFEQQTSHILTPWSSHTGQQGYSVEDTPIQIARLPSNGVFEVIQKASTQTLTVIKLCPKLKHCYATINSVISFNLSFLASLHFFFEQLFIGSYFCKQTGYTMIFFLLSAGLMTENGYKWKKVQFLPPPSPSSH